MHEAPRGRGIPHPALRPGLRVDRVGTEAVVLDPVAARVHRLTGPAAEVLRRLVMDGRDVADLPARLAPAVAGLREAGVLRGDVGRRQAIGAAAAGTVGILTLALPAAAAASTGGGGGGGSGTAFDDSPDGSLNPTNFVLDADFDYRFFIGSFTATEGDFKVAGSGALTVDVLMVGGGGGGGGSFYGGGGGGGGVSILLNRDVAVGDVRVNVGAGGSTGTNGGAGGPSGFGDDTVAGGGGGAANNGAGGASPGGAGGSANFAGGAGGGNGEYGGGGGAGAGGVGAAGAGQAGGDGGVGFTLTGFGVELSGGVELVLGGGGGGGGFASGGAGGAGGGGGGSVYKTQGSSGELGRGGGGGGAADTPPRSGGSGLVIVRYRKP